MWKNAFQLNNIFLKAHNYIYQWLWIQTYRCISVQAHDALLNILKLWWFEHDHQVMFMSALVLQRNTDMSMLMNIIFYLIRWNAQ